MSDQAIGTVTAPPSHEALRRRAILGIGAGNLLEWYDFAVYAALATLLGKLFFASTDALTGLLATFSIFAVGYLARPLGALIFGQLADRKGRKATLFVVITIMGTATVLIGVIPTYASIGVLAPILLTAARIAQGISVGGEFSTSTSYLVEIAPEGRRGLYGSVSYLTANLGFALGLGLVYLLNSALDSAAMDSWGWRVPFLLSFPLLLVGMYLRTNITETPAFAALLAEGRTVESPLKSTLRNQWRPMARLLGMGFVFATSTYTVLAFALSYLLVVQEEPASVAYPSVLLVTVIGALLVPVFGALSDHYGRRPILLAGVAGVLVLSFPGFLLMSSGGFAAVTAGQLLLWLPAALFCGVFPAAFCELFPTRTRTTSVGLPMSVATAIFSGTTPVVATLLIEWTGSNIAPAGYLVASALISTAFVWTLTESAKRELAD
ncbi:MFS transporter [Rhodococcus opacus]|uniref:MFS transporter n=1 Tax=Rhodococcus opacus TaxID=37919 RepID=UPI002948F5F7|nr:MFS transporter [Rhodococcus opacus]MDV6247858.1 MFS transporter [Rhodococcus opacus]